MKFYRILILFFAVQSLSLQAQQKTIIYGRVSDTAGIPLFLVNVFAEGTTYGTVTTDQGNYELELPSGKMYTIIASSIGYQKGDTTLFASPGKRIRFDQKLKISSKALNEVSISHRQDKSLNMQRVDMRSFDQLPNASGNLETILKTLPGVSSGNELSSQYSVRGGNFDENLVYVNDVEIYRPFLIRSGQQEGLSFVNPDLVSSVQFSAGGFESRFGDKMSSVLDITYRKPERKAGSASLSLLGGSAHYEGISGNKKFTWLAGLRYKTSKYLLTSLDTKGEYNPSFIDFQSYLTYQVSDKLELSFLGNIAQNKYNFIPKDRETQFGTVNTALS
ncbi:MAG TPA: TonB-dependent receptor, partial [Bacteroidales bacterium]|nr:TonB-dependent receptor [Bacteroidales bacterium]